MALAMATGSLLCNPSASPLTIPFLARVSLRPSGIFCKFLNTSFLHFGGEWRRRSILKRSTRKQQQQQQQVCSARASAGEDQRDTKEPQFLNSPGELRYFGKLSVGCVAGAILVKYGSLIVPEITRPNLDQALLMICTPVIASIVLLTLASIVGSGWLTKQQ